MITRFKLFEIVHGRTDKVTIDPITHTITHDEKPQEGDFAIVTKNGPAKILNKFLANNIGVIVKVNQGWYDVKFENTPPELAEHFTDNVIRFADLKNWSHSKKDLESFIKAQQFDL